MSRTKAEKRQQLSSDDEDEDVEQKDDDLELLMDEEERERFNQMSEKEREIEIFKRLEQREIMKTREQIKRKLEMAAGKGANERGRQKKKRRISADSDASDGEADGPTTKSRHKARAATSDEEEEGELDQDTSEDETLAGDGGGDSSQKKKGKGTTSAAVKSEASESVFDAEYHKPSELANKQNKKKAMTDLLNKRREKKQAEEKKKKEAQKAALDLDEIFGNDDKEDGKSMSSISSSTSSSRSSSPECNKSRSPSPAVALPISTRPDLLKAQIIRRRLARIVHAPFFAKVAIGCFVRVQIGTNEGRPTYRIAQVMDVVETAKIYEVEPGTDIRTNKGFKLKISNNEPHRVIRLEFVSNGEFTDTEFAFWLKRMQETASPMPTMDFVERKGKEVRDALGYNYTDAEINLMVKEKQRFKRQPHNFAFQKAELLKQKEEAAQDGDTERMRDLQQQINDFEEKAKKIDYQRTKSLSAVTAINQRNREHMKQIFLGTDRQHSEAMQVKDDDPFTRKSARMKMVTGGRIKQETTEEANSVTGIQQKTTVLSSSSTHAIGASALPASLSKTGGGDPGTSRRLSISSDLFSAHGIEINIDFGKMIPASSSSGFRAPPIGGINNSMLQQQQHPTSHHPLQQKPSTGSSRTLTLEEYKRKYSTRLT